MRLFDKRLLGEARQVRADLALTVCLGALGGVLTVLQARALSRAVDQVFLGSRGLSDIRPLLTALLVLALARAGTIWGSQTVAGRGAVRVKTSLRERLFRHVLALGPTYARGERTGELANAAVEGVEALDAYFSQYLPQVALAALVPLIILAFVLPLDPLSGLVLLLTAPLIPLFMILIGDQAGAMTRRQWLSLSRMSAHFLDVLQGLPTLKLFNRSRDQRFGIATVTDRHRRATMGVLRVAFLSALVLELVATISTAVVAVEVGLRLLYGRLAFEQAFFILILAPEFYLPLRLLGARFHAGVAGATAAARIYEILDSGSQSGDRNLGSRISPEAPPLPASRPAVPDREDAGQSVISFRRVSYRYPDETREALEEVSFDLRPGQRVALVGPSGSGKSTIAQILLRFAEPSAGEIRVNGTLLQDLPAVHWRQRIAWVPQLPYLFNASVAENIRLGRPNAPLPQVALAARQAGADAFIGALPQRYDTIVGERGARLSGGQAQRIALARAFLLDAPVVVLDEATANLDPDIEAEIEESLDALLSGRTALVIAHRLHTICRADLILVLDGGRIVQSGTHAELSTIEDGLYARMLAVHSAPGAGRAEPQPTGCGSALARAAVVGTRDAGNAAFPAPISLPDPAPAPSPELAHTPDATRGTPRPSRFRFPISGSTRHASRFTFHVSRSTSPVLPFLLSFLAPFWPRILLSVFLGFAAVACGIGLMGAAAWIIASAALGPSIASLEVAIVGVRSFGIARGFARYAERLVSHDVTFRVLARLRVWFYGAVEPLAPAGLARERSGDLLSRVIGDIGMLESFYLRAVAPAAVALLTAILAGLLVGRAGAALAAALLIFLALAGVAGPLFVRSLSRRPGRKLADARGELGAWLVDGIQGMADLTAFGGQSALLERVRKSGRELGRLQDRMAAIGGLNEGMVTFCTALAVLTVLAGATPLVAGGALSGVTLAVLVMIAQASFEAVMPLPAAGQQLEASLEAGRRLLALAGAAQQATFPRPATGITRTQLNGGFVSPEPGSSRQARPAPEVPDLRVENLRFRYEETGPWTLDSVSFELSAGAHLALVGPSGSGKTTLVNLLLRFWDAQEGRVRLAGRDVRGLDPEDVRRSFGAVAQGTYLFSGTIRDNLLLARPGATQEMLDEAMARAQLADFIRSLPRGYDTWVGEYGLRLSGGERQRLALARVLLRDAPILILDEPVANLDPMTARAVLDATRELMAGRSVLSISHSPIGLAEADQVLVLRNGRIVEQGRHIDLLAHGGFYRRLWQNEGVH
jgi:ATP-binding cassette subfamily C protein CydCD